MVSSLSMEQVWAHSSVLFPTPCRNHADTVSNSPGESSPNFPLMSTKVFAVAVAASSVVAAALVGAPAVGASVERPATSATSLVSNVEAEPLIQIQAKKNRKVAKGPKGNKIRVSKVRRLPSGGSFLTIKGRGFDPRVGVYVGLCVKPAPGQKPSPCGGGVDTDGSSQASAWVSSNPPAYGDQLATRYGRNGSFKVRIYVSSRISSTIDCRTTKCAITTRADHTRSSDRTWDLVVPVRFAKS